MLLRTRIGNWVFAVGGAQQSARQVGVPVFATKVGLFMTTAGAGWLVGMLLIFTTSTVQSNTGVGQEFIYIICAVVGGCLLTGGYGSAIGAALGALIYGMVNQGIVYSGWDNNWLKAFLGVMLLGAVLLNEWVRKRAETSTMSAAATEPTDRHAPAERGTAVIEVRDIGKHYGNIIALSEVSTSVRAGEVTCVLGDNGAGKSTFIKILAGAHGHSDGSASDRRRAHGAVQPPCRARARYRHGLPGPRRRAADAGVAQLLPRQRDHQGVGPLRRLDVEAMKRISKSELAAMGIDLRDVDQPIGTLSGGERQCVAIARAVYFGARVLILDEPTAALGVKQSGVVLKYIAKARDRGLGVVFITHNPHHAYPVGDRFMLLRRGKSMGDFSKSEITVEELTVDDGRRHRAGLAR